MWSQSPQTVWKVSCAFTRIPSLLVSCFLLLTASSIGCTAPRLAPSSQVINASAFRVSPSSAETCRCIVQSTCAFEKSSHVACCSVEFSVCSPPPTAVAAASSTNHWVFPVGDKLGNTLNEEHLVFILINQTLDLTNCVKSCND